MGFEYWEVGAVTEVFGERVPEGGSSDGEGSVTPGVEVITK